MDRLRLPQANFSILDAVEPPPREREHPDRLRVAGARSATSKKSAPILWTVLHHIIELIEGLVDASFIAYESPSQAILPRSFSQSQAPGHFLPSLACTVVLAGPDCT